MGGLICRMIDCIVELLLRRNESIYKKTEKIS